MPSPPRLCVILSRSLRLTHRIGPAMSTDHGELKELPRVSIRRNAPNGRHNSLRPVIILTSVSSLNWGKGKNETRLAEPP